MARLALALLAAAMFQLGMSLPIIEDGQNQLIPTLTGLPTGLPTPPPFPTGFPFPPGHPSGPPTGLPTPPPLPTDLPTPPPFPTGFPFPPGHPTGPPSGIPTPTSFLPGPGLPPVHTGLPDDKPVKRDIPVTPKWLRWLAFENIIM